MNHLHPPAAALPIRAALAAAALAATVLLALAVIAAFGSVSHEPFLRDTPQARAAVARCDALGERGARQHCMRHLIAAAKASDAGSASLAAIEAERRQR